MRIIDNKILFSATDLCNFLECEHLTSLDKINLTTPLPQTPDGDDAKLFQDKGFEHEQSYLQKLIEIPLFIPVKIIDRSGRPIILIEGSVCIPVVPSLRVEGFVEKPHSVSIICRQGFYFLRSITGKIWFRVIPVMPPIGNIQFRKFLRFDN